MTTRRHARPQDLESLPTPTPRADGPIKTIEKKVKEHKTAAATTTATDTTTAPINSCPFGRSPSA